MQTPDQSSSGESLSRVKVPVDARHIAATARSDGGRGGSAAPAYRRSDYQLALRIALPSLPLLIALAMWFELLVGLRPVHLAVEILAATALILLWIASRRAHLSSRRTVYGWLALIACCLVLAVPWWDWLLLGASGLSVVVGALGLILALAPLAVWWPGFLFAIAALTGLALSPLYPAGQGLTPWLVMSMLLLGAVPMGLAQLRRRELERLLHKQVYATAHLREQLADQQQRARYELERRREAQRELDALRELAEGASHAKTEFLATMSHEIRTPLNGVLPILELLENTELNPEQRRLVRTAFSSSRHLLRIIDDILDFAKAESGKLQLESVEIDPRELIDSVMELMQGSARSKGLTLQADIDDALPRLLRCDPIRVRQVLINLLSNAIKFTGSGSVKLTVEVRRASRKEVEVGFEVVDTGIGLSRETARKLFTSFTQADASTTRKHGGTGLGLAICKRLVTLMGGRIGVNSQPSAGSTFWFVLPMRKSAADVPAARQDLRGARVLSCIVDPDTATLVAEQLHKWDVRELAVPPGQVCESLHDAALLGRDEAIELLLVDTRGLEAEVGGLLDRVRDDRLLRKLPIAVAGDDKVLLQRLHREFGAYIVSGGLRPSPLQSCLNRLLDVQVNPGVTLKPLPESYLDLNLDREPALPTSEVSSETDTAREPPLASHATALLVEDNPVNLGVVKAVLERLGVAVRVAGDGQAALQQLAVQRCDLVFMDCQMPVMDGYQATREWRRREAAAGGHVPIVAMTANAMQGDRERCLDAGMDDYLAKPVSISQLRDVLQRWLPAGLSAARPADPQALAAVDGEALIDTSVLTELRDVLEDEVGSLLKIYLENAPQLVGQLDDAAAASDLEAMILPAHSLKSSSANLGAMRLSELARRIELAARQGDAAQALAARAQLADLLAATLDALRAELNVG